MRWFVSDVIFCFVRRDFDAATLHCFVYRRDIGVVLTSFNKFGSYVLDYGGGICLLTCCTEFRRYIGLPTRFWSTDVLYEVPLLFGLPTRYVH